MAGGGGAGEGCAGAGARARLAAAEQGTPFSPRPAYSVGRPSKKEDGEMRIAAPRDRAPVPAASQLAAASSAEAATVGLDALQPIELAPPPSAPMRAGSFDWRNFGNQIDPMRAIIPSDFAANHLETRSHDILLLRANKKDKWHVKYYHGRATRGFHCRRWIKFVQDNGLRKDFICIFELMKGAKRTTMVVHVARKVNGRFIMAG
ncbi:hypothetical protein EJB05_00662, partial [Eragrostis curvula]